MYRSLDVEAVVEVAPETRPGLKAATTPAGIGTASAILRREPQLSNDVNGVLGKHGKPLMHSLGGDIAIRQEMEREGIYD
jgi:hypothetical protein